MMTTLLNKIRSYLLSPDSPIELFLRTVYHKVLATRWFFHWQNFLAKRSYRKFQARQSQVTAADTKALPSQPTITFILSCADKSPNDLDATLQSIKSLHGDHWEALIFSNDQENRVDFKKSDDPRIILTKQDNRRLLQIISGEFVVFCEAGDLFDETLMIEFYQSLLDSPPADVTYFDCEYFDENSGTIRPFFKPSASSPALLLSVNYLSRGFFHKPALEQIWGGVDWEPNLSCLEYDLATKLCEIGNKLFHIPKVLLTQKRLTTPHTPDLRKVLAEHLTRQGLEGVSSSEHDIGVRFTWQTHSPSLAIVVLSKNNYRFLHSLIPALVQQPYHGEKSIYIVDNGSDDLATTSFYQEIRQQSDITIIPYPKPFNYSEAINLGVRESESDLVLLMNDDMAVFNDTWLDELAQWTVRPEIGVVSAKLLRKNRNIQHAGIIMGLTGFIGHIYLNAPENYHGLLGSANWYRNFLAITGACQMVRREVFNQVGGYDEAYRLAFGDIDFCLKVHEQGYQNVYSPFAQLYHFEGSTRGYQTPLEDALKGYDTMEPYLINEDPYFSQNLTYTRIPRCVNKMRTVNERKQSIEARKRFYLKNK